MIIYLWLSSEITHDTIIVHYAINRKWSIFISIYFSNCLPWLRIHIERSSLEAGRMCLQISNLGSIAREWVTIASASQNTDFGQQFGFM